MMQAFIRTTVAFAVSGLIVAAQDAPEQPVKPADAQEPAKPAGTDAAGTKAPEEKPGLSVSVTGDKKSSMIKRIVPKTEEAPIEAAYSREYVYLVAEAMKCFQGRDFRGAIKLADKADALMPPSPYTLNVRGAVAIEEGDYDKGKDFCMRALKVQPGFFPARFNLCEIPFNQGDYKLARTGFTVLYNETQRDDPTIELLAYRIFLTYLLDSDVVHARDWLDKIPFPSQTPAYQYANAAWERKHGRINEWREWLRSAEFIWPEIKRVNYADVLIHLGWLKDTLEPNDGSE